jgi:hypothetical protein
MTVTLRSLLAAPCFCLPLAVAPPIASPPPKRVRTLVFNPLRSQARHG